MLERFDGCALKATATQLVFADGNPQARVMFVGEAPGREEDIEGLPFVGRSGKLLDLMMAAIGLDRTSAYIANVVPWRPPGNRTPTPQETAICIPFILRQIELADPDVLVCMGNPSTQTLLATKDGITKTRGRWLAFHTGTREIRAIPTYHPAFLLRSPLQKRFAWRDFLAIEGAGCCRRLMEMQHGETIERALAGRARHVDALCAGDQVKGGTTIYLAGVTARRSTHHPHRPEEFDMPRMAGRGPRREPQRGLEAVGRRRRGDGRPLRHRPDRPGRAQPGLGIFPTPADHRPCRWYCSPPIRAAWWRSTRSPWWTDAGCRVARPTVRVPVGTRRARDLPTGMSTARAFAHPTQPLQHLAGFLPCSRPRNARLLQPSTMSSRYLRAVAPIRRRHAENRLA